MADHRQGKSSRVQEVTVPKRAADIAPGPGKRTLVEAAQSAMPVQARDNSHARPTESVHEAAARGIATPSTSVPGLEGIRPLFGRHGAGLSKVQLHAGGEAAASAKAMGAEAFATGNHIVTSTNDKHTMYHELAHSAQQASGKVQLSGGVGEVGDPYERNADEVADLLIQGKSAEAALDRITGSGSACPGVQLMEEDHGSRSLEDPDNNRFSGGPLQPSRTPASLDGPIQRLTMSAANAAIPVGSPQRALFDQWLAARNPGQGSDPSDTPALGNAMILHSLRSADELRATLAQFDKHRAGAATHTRQHEADIATQLHNALLTSRYLARARKLSLAEIKASLRFLGEADFTAAYTASKQALNPNLSGRAAWSTAISDARRIDGVGAFEHNGMVNMRKGPANADMHTAVHELIHKLSAASFRTVLGHPLTEGATEHIATLVCNELGIPMGAAYAGEQKLFQALARAFNFDEGQQLDLYLKDPTPMVRQLKAKLGDAGYAIFIAEKDPVTASQTYGAQARLRQQSRSNEPPPPVRRGWF